jgi:pimeloyl-ACP methyl ester carboxylesterase
MPRRPFSAPALRRSLAAAALAAAAGAGAPAAASAAPVAQLSGGAPAQPTVVCGTSQAVRAVVPGAHLTAVVPGAKSKAARRARLGTTLVVEQCVAGAWKQQQRIKVGGRAHALRRALDSTAIGDIRIRTRTRKGGSGRAQYARVGVGEIVDVPVAFKVVNQNRTPVPCLGAPDGKTYEIHGSLVAPRTVLDSGAAAATLYLHGLGYSGFFFRFQAVPGYDYGRQQAEAGHASVVVTRLGNPSDPGLSDGNKTCLSSQADMADQMIGALRSGSYTLGGGAGKAFKKVALAGHSLGGFITEITQYSFHSADAIAVIGYTDVPSPLALLQFSNATADCLTAPKHAGPGDAGPPNYAPYGETDQDFIGAHLYDIDPAVQAAVVKMKNRDPCGDLISAGATLVANQPLIRTITGPVLVISGGNDALFPPPTNLLQAKTGYPLSDDVQLVELPNTGHAVTLGLSHGAFRAAMDTWLKGHGF